MPENELDNVANSLKGVDRAAILMLALGEKDAATILAHMGPKEVQAWVQPWPACIMCPPQRWRL